MQCNLCRITYEFSLLKRRNHEHLRIRRTCFVSLQPSLTHSKLKARLPQTRHVSGDVATARRRQLMVSSLCAYMIQRKTRLARATCWVPVARCISKSDDKHPQYSVESVRASPRHHEHKDTRKVPRAVALHVGTLGKALKALGFTWVSPEKYQQGTRLTFHQISILFYG